MKFSSQNQPSPEKRSGGRTDNFTRLVKAIEKKFESGVDKCETFEEWLVMKAIDDGGVYLQELLKRVSPPYKQTYQPVSFDFPSDGTPSDKANAVLNAIADGDISPDVGHLLIDAISKSLGIEEITDFAKRLEALEKLADAQKA